MKASVYISSEQIEAIGYTKKGRNFTVDEYEVYPLPEGTMINGRIIDSGSLTECLVSLRAKNPELFKNTSLVIDGSSISTKKVVVPKLNKWQYYQLINDDFADTADNFKELLCDYQMLKTKDGTTAILSCASDKTQVEGYISAFKDAGINLKSVHIGVQSIMNYVDSRPELQNSTIVINIIDGFTMLSVIFENGINVFMSRVRLYSDHKQQFVSDIHNHLSGLIQFVQSEKLSAITHSYYLGLDGEDLSLLKTVNQHPSIRFEGLEIFNSSARVKNIAPSAHFAYLNIALGAGSIDLIGSIRTLEQFRKRQKPKKIAIPIFAGILVVLAAPAVYMAYEMSNINNDIDGFKSDIAAMAEKAEELDTIMAETAFYSNQVRQHDQKNELNSSLTAISNEIIDLIYTTHSDRITVSRIEFNEATGFIRLAARSVDALDSTAYVAALQESYLVETVLYTGYTQGSDAGGRSYNFNIDVKIAVLETEEDEDEDEESEVNS